MWLFLTWLMNDTCYVSTIFANLSTRISVTGRWRSPNDRCAMRLINYNCFEGDENNKRVPVLLPRDKKFFSPTRHYCKHPNNSDYWQERVSLFRGILSFIFLKRPQENRQSRPQENTMIDPKHKLLTL
jgi:hypothetical protein